MPRLRLLPDLWVAAATVAVVASGCSGGESEYILEQEVSQLTIEVTSPAFTEGKPIPTQYTCDGQDRSPLLSWTGVPDGTKSIALIADDPDAPGGTWVHWVLYGLGPEVNELQEGLAATSEVLPGGAKQGVNDFKRTGYGGPCPPVGHGPHRYYFKVYALDGDIDLDPGATKAALQREMDGHILAQDQLTGTYERK